MLDPTHLVGPTVFVSAAEPSADRHGAALLRAFTRLCPNARFVGACGPAMRDAGCECIYDMTEHAAMLLGVLGAVRRGAAMIAACDRQLRLHPFDAAVLIDSPTLHLPLAAKAQAAAVPTLYYIAPQLWAWGAYRIYRVRHRVDKLATILPFEQEYFSHQGIDATYVGHPLVESIAANRLDTEKITALKSTGDPVIALLPGSRRHVVSEVLPGQLEVAHRIAAAYPQASVLLSSAGQRVEPLIRQLAASCSARITIVSGYLGEILESSDLVLVASGTTALEVAMHRKPMIVMYNASRWFYQLIARWFINTPHLSLPNIIAQREIVPEFMPYYTSTEPIAERALALLSSESLRQDMVTQLGYIVESLGTISASERTAQLLLDLINTKHQ